MSKKSKGAVRCAAISAETVLSWEPGERRGRLIEEFYPDLPALLRSRFLWETARRYPDFEDAVQTAAVCLCEKAEHYDPTLLAESTGKACKPMTFFLWHIRHKLQSELRRHELLSGPQSDQAGEYAGAADYRCPDGDAATVLGEPVQRDMWEGEREG